MKAAVVSDSKSIVVQEFPVPSPDNGEVVVKVEYCGICGSEISLFTQGEPPMGSILGHEMAGTVAYVGSGATEWKVGQRVVSTAYGRCGICHWCSHGHPQLCENKYWIGLGYNPGAFAEFCKVRSSMLIEIPAQVSLREAALIEPLAVALHAVRNAHVNLGDRVAVIGMGSVGLLVLQAVQLAGAHKVAVVELVSQRLALADRLGAKIALTPNEATGSALQEAWGHLPDFVFDCAGKTSTLQLAADLVSPRGKIILVGLSPNPVPIMAKEWSKKEITLQASMAYGDEFQLAIDLVSNRRVDVGSLISEVISIEQLDRTMKNLTSPNNQIKVLVAPNETNQP